MPEARPADAVNALARLFAAPLLYVAARYRRLDDADRRLDEADRLAAAALRAQAAGQPDDAALLRLAAQAITCAGETP